MNRVNWEMDYILIHPRYPIPEEHRHFAQHLIWSRSGTLECIVEGARVACRGVCIDSGVVHTVKVPPGDAAVMLIEETSELSRRVSALFLKGRPWATLEDGWVERLSDLEAEEEQALYVLLGVEKKARADYDERITGVLRAIRDSETVEAELYEYLARHVCLSPSRLSHLFRDEVGISLAGYLAMEKLYKTYVYIQNGESLTDASVHAGFSSASHFAAAHREKFGITCSDFLNARQK